MPHTIAEATSGRAKCRGCKQAIKKGELRLGEAVPNPFGDGEAVHWYHLECGARRRAEAFLEAVAGATEGQTAAESHTAAESGTAAESHPAAESGTFAAPAIPLSAEQLEPLLALAELGKTYYRLQRFVGVHVAPSGRARCQGCRELIEKGALRFVLERVEDGIVSGAGFVHVQCAHAYAGAVDGMLERVGAHAELSEEQWGQVKKSLQDQAELPREVKIPYAQRS